MARGWRGLGLLPITVFLTCGGAPSLQGGFQGEEDFRRQRLLMLETQLRNRDIRNERVLRAMGEVPRHLFVPSDVRRLAYSDRPLPIGLDQTISQPYIVALMTQLADPGPNDRALEVGTGSGYQAAVLAELVREVYSIEIVEALADRARRTLTGLGYSNVTVRSGDGYQGWPDQAPFDLILVTAAAERIPEPLLDQLSAGGRLVMPLGPVGGIQTLTLLTRSEEGITETETIPVRFVPMTGEIETPR